MPSQRDDPTSKVCCAGRSRGLRCRPEVHHIAFMWNGEGCLPDLQQKGRNQSRYPFLAHERRVGNDTVKRPSCWKMEEETAFVVGSPKTSGCNSSSQAGSSTLPCLQCLPSICLEPALNPSRRFVPLSPSANEG